ncbi:fatty acyl-CoA reductase 1-like isoform X3 [Tachypleus tridentatus]|uniref:fatty acyl-CoA reductase 1-like isoform X3 n=1 Tax=Tachypleus tridentatus TaxID=6853 RepID=UPI003FD316D2
MPHLVALIHVSTTYCNCDIDEVDEIVYPPPANPQKIIDAIEWMDEDLITSITAKLLRNHLNTYAYTKALAENIFVVACCHYLTLYCNSSMERSTSRMD